VPRCSAFVALSISILAFAMGACANRTQSAAGPDGLATPIQEVFAPDPTAPLGIDGKKVADATSAALPFVPLVLASVEPASQWVLLDPHPAATAAALVYSTADWGSVTVLETLHTGTNEDQLAWEATLKDSGCSPVPDPNSDFVGQTCSYDPFRRVSLSNGIVALLSESGGVTSITWVEAAKESIGMKLDQDLNLYVQVFGTSELSSAEAIKLADSLEKDNG
jgi:hypothetical protein